MQPLAAGIIATAAVFYVFLSAMPRTISLQLPSPWCFVNNDVLVHYDDQCSLGRLNSHLDFTQHSLSPAAVNVDC